MDLTQNFFVMLSCTYNYKLIRLKSRILQVPFLKFFHVWISSIKVLTKLTSCCQNTDRTKMVFTLTSSGLSERAAQCNGVQSQCSGLASIGFAPF